MTDRPLSFVFSFSPGGTLGRAFIAVTDELGARGHAVTLLAPPSYAGEVVEGAGRAEVRAWPADGVETRAAWRFVDQALADTAPDAVVGSFSGTNVLLTAARRRRVPARIAWHHTTSVASRMDGTTGLRWHSQRLRKRLAYRWATDLLVATDHVALDLERAYGVDPAKVTVEPFAIPDPGPQSVERIPGRVVVVGRFYPVKGHDWLLRALPAVAAAVPDLDVRFVGDGPERPRLEAQAASLPVRFLGLVDREAVSRELAEASVAVVPSRDEGFGLVTVEAQAVGTPVVASDIAAFRTTVDGGVTGVLVPVDDDAALAAAITRTLTDPGAMGAAARRRFEERFDLARRGPEQADGYERLVRRRLR